MSARVEVTKKYALAYGRASRKDKSRILDQVVEVTGWNRDHARQQLRRRLAQPKGRASATVAVIDRRRTKPRKYSYDALRVLQRVWATAGGICDVKAGPRPVRPWRWPPVPPRCGQAPDGANPARSAPADP